MSDMMAVAEQVESNKCRYCGRQCASSANQDRGEFCFCSSWWGGERDTDYCRYLAVSARDRRIAELEAELALFKKSTSP